MIHGVAGDERLVFFTEVLNGKVAAYDRFSGARVGELPAPPDGFLLPFTLRIPATGHLVVLDAGGFPNPAVPAIPRVYDYSYHWNRATHSLEASLDRTVRFDGLPVVFSEDVEVTEDGTYVLSDSVLGSLWLIERNGEIRPGLVPSSFNFGEGLPFMQPCIVGPTIVEGIPYDLGGGIGPGVGSVASNEGYVYWGSFCHGGVHRISMQTLRDDTRTAEARAAEIETVTAAAPGTLELLKGLTFNRFDPRPERALYAADCFNLRMVRIDVETGERRVVLQSASLMDFPVAAAFVPGGFGIQSLFVSSDQEHRFDALNFGISGGDLFIPPFVGAEILLRD